MKVLNYLQPENPVAKGIVIILIMLFVVWLALLVYWGLWLRRQQRQMEWCADVEVLAEALRALIVGAGKGPRGMVEKAAPTLAGVAEARESAFKEYCGVKGMGEHSIVASHLKVIFDAGCKGGHLEVGELVKHTTNQLFRGNGLLRSLLALFIILGLLGSLFGLADSLSQLSPVMPGAAVYSNEQLSQNLTQLLSQLKSAFAPSIWGILLTIFGVILFTCYLQLLCSPVKDILERLTLSVWAPQLFPTTTQRLQETLLLSERQMVRSLDATKKVADFAESVHKEGGELKQSLAKANQTLRLLNQSVEGIGVFTQAFTKGVTSLTGFQTELRDLYQSMADGSKAFQESIKANVKGAEVFYENARRTIDNQHQQLEAALKGLASYEKAYIESRREIDARIEEVLDQAGKAYTSLGERNLELVEAVGNPLRDDLKKSLGEVENALTVQLQGIQNRFSSFDTPIKAAAEVIAGSQEAMVKRTESLTRELQREILKMEEKHIEQSEHMGAVNEQIGVLLAELVNARKAQSEQTQVWSQAMSLLAQTLASLGSSFTELNQTLKNPTQSLPQLGHLDEQNKRIIYALSTLSEAVQSQSKQARELAVQMDSVQKGIGSLARSARSSDHAVRNINPIATSLPSAGDYYGASKGQAPEEKAQPAKKAASGWWPRLKEKVWSRGR